MSFLIFIDNSESSKISSNKDTRTGGVLSGIRTKNFQLKQLFYKYLKNSRHRAIKL